MDSLGAQLVVDKLEETKREHLPELQEKRLVEVEALVGALRGAAERGLQREGVDKVELPPHNHARAGLSAFLHLKVAVVEAEVVVHVVENFGKNAFLQPVTRLRLGVAKHEQIVVG